MKEILNVTVDKTIKDELKEESEKVDKNISQIVNDKLSNIDDDQRIEKLESKLSTLEERRTNIKEKISNCDNSEFIKALSKDYQNGKYNENTKRTFGPAEYWKDKTGIGFDELFKRVKKEVEQ